VVRGIIDEGSTMGLSARELRRMSELRKVDEALQRAMVGATGDQVTELLALGEVMRGNVIAALDDTERKQRSLNESWEVGAVHALDAYAEAASNRAAQAENFVNGGLQRMEDALVNFTKTGKLNFGDLFGFMAEEFLRNQIRMAAAGGVDWLKLLFTFGGSGATTYGSLGGGQGTHFSDNGSLPYLANGLSYVPYDNFPAILHQGERVMTKQENAGGGDGGASINAGIGTVNVGQGVSMGQVMAAIRQSQAMQSAQIQRARSEGRL
jgi:lambda family phage tail tape measure protein